MRSSCRIPLVEGRAGSRSSIQHRPSLHRVHFDASLLQRLSEFGQKFRRSTLMTFAVSRSGNIDQSRQDQEFKCLRSYFRGFLSQLFEIGFQHFLGVCRVVGRSFWPADGLVLPKVDPLRRGDEEKLGPRQSAVRQHISTKPCSPIFRRATSAFGFHQKNNSALFIIRNEVNTAVSRHSSFSFLTCIVADPPHN